MMFKSIDPRSAVISAFTLSIVIACAMSLKAAAAGLLFGICMLTFSSQSLCFIVRRLWIANIFILFLWFIVPFTTPGEIVWQYGVLKVSKPGLDLALLVTIKANALICIFIALVVPLGLPFLGAALSYLKIPEKLIWIFLIMGRNIAVLSHEWKILAEAARLRAFRTRTNIYSYRVIASMLAILLLRAHEKAEIASEAILLRGYNGKLPRFETLKFSLADVIFCILMTCMIFFILGIEWGLILTTR